MELNELLEVLHQAINVFVLALVFGFVSERVIPVKLDILNLQGPVVHRISITCGLEDAIVMKALRCLALR